MRVAIDTNCYRDFCEGVPKAIDVLRRAEQIIMPFPVLAELRAGFSCGTLARKNERTLNLFIGRPRVLCLYADEQTTFHFARMFAQLRQQGTPIPTHDIWIGALVQQHNLMLFTRDRHFDNLPQLARVEV